jgi:hypothetical protein
LFIIYGGLAAVAKISKAWKMERLALGLDQIKQGKKPQVTLDGSVPTRPLVPCPDVLEHVVDEAVEPMFVRYGLRMRRLNNGEGKFEHSLNYATYGIIGGGDYLGWLIHGGRHIEVELKRGRGGNLSKDQQDRFNDCWDDDAIFVVVHGVEELKYFYDVGWDKLTRQQAGRNIKWR